MMTSGVNLDILNLLRHEPSSPRDIAGFLGKDETDVSRRLRSMERAGIVKGVWSRRKEKNVRVYSLLGFHAEIDFDPTGLSFQLRTATKASDYQTTVLSSYEVPSISGFMGRENDLRSLTSEEGLHVIIGLPGIGKTSLAAVFASSAIGTRPVFWHTIREVDSFGYLANKVAVFLARLGFSEALEYVQSGGDEDRVRIELLGKGLNNLRAITVFDDYHRNRDDRLDSLLEHLWRDCARVKILLLSRSRPKFYTLGQRARELWMQGLSLEETKRLLSSWRVDITEGEAEQLWRRLSGHPLSLTLFNSLAKEGSTKVPLSNMSEQLTAYFTKEIYSTLTPEERDVLLTLSVFRAAVTPRALSEILHLKNLNYLVHNLENKMLVRRQQDVLVVHEVEKAAFYGFLDRPEKIHASVARYYLRSGTPEDALEALFHFKKSKDTSSVLDIFKREIERESYRFVEHGDSAVLLSILDQFEEPVGAEDRYYFLCLRGKARARLGRWERASTDLTEAIQIANKLRKRTLLAHATKCLAECCYWKGDLKQTETHLLAAAGLFEELQMRDHLGRAYSQLARLYFLMGKHSEAKRLAELAEGIAEFSQSS
jgi:ATP/maltotriose-dependent transcriptional regulator MalT